MPSECSGSLSVMEANPSPLFTRDLILEAPAATPVQELQMMMSELPCQLTADDIPDFVSLAQYYASRTPQSFRKVGGVVDVSLTEYTDCCILPAHRTTTVFCLAVGAACPP